MEETIKNLESLLQMENFPSKLSYENGQSSGQLDIFAADVNYADGNEASLNFIGEYTFESPHKNLELYLMRLQAGVAKHLAASREINITNMKTSFEAIKNILKNKDNVKYFTTIRAVSKKGGAEQDGTVSLSLESSASSRPRAEITLSLNLPLSIAKQVFYSISQVK